MSSTVARRTAMRFVSNTTLLFWDIFLVISLFTGVVTNRLSNVQRFPQGGLATLLDIMT
jgi:hypothetical protein